ncbi:glutamate ABC transporter substrate-binding protein [Actinocrispum wychmicini]|uniref:Polar amino acid transport system substrate-binding protein n=1 Tax=Actinocrispum wychmicini TaxID=1213861 RepID=A0A4R2J7J6_9PSEU|nr:glutamate ABC transporter substrate-binding protein [Actinocrispum wychmicini]TCO52576.1 polar amino acid transport system substrate-binding protein [Actinocrispum wychmicini]
MNRRLLAAGLGLAAALVAGCSTSSGGTTIPTVSAAVPKPGAAQDAAAVPPPGQQNCGNLLASKSPLSPLPKPGAMPAGMAKIVARGKLIVGVDQNTFNVGFRDPFTGEIQGFDIDMAKAIAQAIFGDPNAIQLRAVTSDQRIPFLKSGDVDIVVRTMSITCDRKNDVDFSAVYYQATQRVLVKKNSGITGAEQLGGKRVCANKGSTSLSKIANQWDPKPVPVQVSDWTDCLVMLQQNEVDAVSTDDVILAGMAAQDRYTEMVGPSLGAEPYGMAVAKTPDKDFLRFVNGVIEQVRGSGRWTSSYQKWLGGLIPGATPVPPVPQYES